MHDSENSQGSKQVENVQDNNKSIHLVLFKEIIGIVNHLYIFLLVMSFVVII